MENLLINKYGLKDYSKTVHAFTVCSDDEKIVFIDGTIPPESKLYSLMHETAHIALNHLEANRNITNSRLMEMQAEAFAYEAMQYKGEKYSLILTSGLIFAFLLSAFVFTAVKFSLPSAREQSGGAVFVTETGSRYHRPDCPCIKGAKCIELSKEDAAKLYKPCKICKP